jgi:hypothetical protein
MYQPPHPSATNSDRHYDAIETLASPDDNVDHTIGNTTAQG